MLPAILTDFPSLEPHLYVDRTIEPLVFVVYALSKSWLPTFSATMASTSNMPRIVELAAQISTSVAELQEQLTAQGAPSPSWAEDSPECLPADVSNLQDAVLDATAELHELLLEPLMLIFKFASV